MACFGSMTVSRLKTHRLYLRRQPGAPEEAWLNSGDKVRGREYGVVMVAMVGVVLQGIIQIELPRGERTSVKASGDTTLPELLQVGVNSVYPPITSHLSSLPHQLVCRKRNMEETDVKFDLPATEDSLAGKTLGQLKLTFFKIIPRTGGCRT